MNYVEPDEFARLMRAYKQRRTIAPDLLAVLLKIIGGVHDRFRFWHRQKDDFKQAAFLHLLTEHALDLADPEKPLFGYFTKIVINFGRQTCGIRKAEEEKRLEYLQAIGSESRGPVAEFDSWEPEPDPVAEFDRSPSRGINPLLNSRRYSA